MKRIFLEHKFLEIVILVNLLLLLLCPPIGMKSLYFTSNNFINFLFMLTPIFICIGLLDVWIEKETMIKIMGEKSGVEGTLIAFLLGGVTAVPLYALLPVVGMLLKKGCSLFNILIFLCSSTSIRIPLLLFEISSLGWKFTFIRFILNVFIIIIISYIIQKVVTENERQLIYNNVDKM